MANDYFLVHAPRPLIEALIRTAGRLAPSGVMPRVGGGLVSVPGRRPPSGLRGSAGQLRGRHRECKRLDRLIEAARAGESRALVVRGEPGMGKTALLDYVAEHASGCRVARVAGVQSEMELAYAGLHQLRRRCWAAWSGSRLPSVPCCGARSASVLVGCRTAFWSGWLP